MGELQLPVGSVVAAYQVYHHIHQEESVHTELQKAPTECAVFQKGELKGHYCGGVCQQEDEDAVSDHCELGVRTYQMPWQSPFYCHIRMLFDELVHHQSHSRLFVQFASAKHFNVIAETLQNRHRAEHNSDLSPLLWVFRAEVLRVIYFVVLNPP